MTHVTNVLSKCSKLVFCLQVAPDCTDLALSETLMFTLTETSCVSRLALLDFFLVHHGKYRLLQCFTASYLAVINMSRLALFIISSRLMLLRLCGLKGVLGLFQVWGNAMRLMIENFYGLFLSFLLLFLCMSTWIMVAIKARRCYQGNVFVSIRGCSCCPLLIVKRRTPSQSACILEFLFFDFPLCFFLFTLTFFSQNVFFLFRFWLFNFWF